MKLQAVVYVFLYLVNLSHAHFQFYTPVAIGASNPSQQEEGTGPCGGFDIQNRDVVTDWPIGGYPVYMITTHPKAVLEFRIALANDTNTWIKLIQPINQYGVGHFCKTAIPGFAPWVELPVVLQVAQFAPDGINYQCAAIKFIAGNAVPPASGACDNSPGVSEDAAVGFTSTLPFGSVITPTNTALPTGSNSNATTTTGSTTASVTSAPTATTSKAVSGTVGRFRYEGVAVVGALSGAVLAAWAL